MQLTAYTDYSLRLLLYLGSQDSGKRSSIKEIAEAYQLSTNHLSKIVHDLGKKGLIHTVRGRNGGIELALKPSDINVGAVVRQTEDLTLVECFDRELNQCVVSPSCFLKHVLYDATEAFLSVLDEYTLEDMLKNKEHLQFLLQNN
ncbi:Rrf2 family transcriptional regulator [Halalkalibacter urbisdiaboli]|uniref:Rrf2 family transcriptional regulator n=1 Tax=Halalkalibacter urbisdiaboli TaxID=1960589 RepID=UPI000B450D40|nr:Rrf2 family transcriptional regulator [Halalkalibacter urbisdiaboli]